MANETFTTRSGKEVPIILFTLDAVMMTSILRIKEDFAERGEHLSTYGVVASILDKGIQATRNYWKNSAKQKDNRDLGKAIQFMLSKGLPMATIAEFLQEKTGKKVNMAEPQPETPIVEEEIDLTAEANQLSEEELEAATAPDPTAK